MERSRTCRATRLYAPLELGPDAIDARPASLELTDILRDDSSSGPLSESDHAEDTSFAKQRNDTKPEDGWWAKQMFVDRTLRSMAALMAALATTAVASCIWLATKFDEDGVMATSIPIAAGGKDDMDRRCEVLKFFINMAATLVLSSSNTYQQLITSLSIRDLRHVLVKYGDSRVGTNSPFAIRHKRRGRCKAFLAWILLISTSMPVHLLANSVVGVAVVYTEKVDTYEWNPDYTRNVTRSDPSILDSLCWITLQLGHRPIPSDINVAFSSNDDYSPSESSCEAIKANPTEHPNPWNFQGSDRKVPACWSKVTVSYNESTCGEYRQKLSSYDDVSYEVSEMRPEQPDCTKDQWKEYADYCIYRYNFVGNCTSKDFQCDWISANDSCEAVDHRLVVRFTAAWILAICLAAKAVYMVTINFQARLRIKSQCLTFGDVLAASVIEDVRIPSECAVNGGDSHRRRTIHACHKHCKPWTEPSGTGDELGHCQTCSRFNLVNNRPNLPWPAVATKHKKSLISNLGQTALTQMLTLSLCSTAMLVGSIILTVMYVSYYAKAVCAEWTTYGAQFTTSQVIATMEGNRMWDEIAAFAISNGAQLIYSALYLLLLYNLTLINMEYDWGQFEKKRHRLRCTIVKGPAFDQSYVLQLRKRIMLPVVCYSILMHWLLGLSIYTEERIITNGYEKNRRYSIITVPACVLGSSALLLVLTTGCWWAFTYSREGYMPQMFGSIRTLCAATSELRDFPTPGIQWGDLTKEEDKREWRRAGLSGAPDVKRAVPNELYA